MALGQRFLKRSGKRKHNASAFSSGKSLHLQQTNKKKKRSANSAGKQGGWEKGAGKKETCNTLLIRQCFEMAKKGFERSCSEELRGRPRDTGRKKRRSGGIRLKVKPSAVSEWGACGAGTNATEE